MTVDPRSEPVSSSTSAQAEARIRTLLTRINDTIPAYISYIDADMRYVYVNQTYLNAFGRSASQIEGFPVAEVLGSSYENVRAHLEAALRGETQHFETLMGTVGSQRTLSVSHIPDYGDDGSIFGIIVYGNDVTDRKRTEAALLQSEKLAAVGRLASSIAHEINNPLEAITNLLYLARHHVTDPQTSTYLELADQELRRVSNIANQTLRFHKQASNPRAISAEALFSTVLTIYEGRIKNSHIDVEIDHRTTRPIVCFEGDVRQVLNNLVGNAIDAMPRGGRLLIRSHENAQRNGAILTVADTGSGMSPETLAHIFDPFFTTKGIGGTGLGLWVSKEVAGRHQGVLEVRSSERPGSTGSVFRLLLPHRA